MLKTATENSPKWFGKKRELSSVRDSFNKFLSVSQENTSEGWVPNGKYPPSVRFKLPVYDGKVCMDIIDDASNDVVVDHPSDLPDAFGKGCACKIIAQGSIYVIGQAFGLTWKPCYVEVSKRRRQTARDFFKEDQDDGEAVPTVVSGGARAAFATDDDDDDDDGGYPAGAGAGSATPPEPEVVVPPPVVVAAAPAAAAAAAPRRRKVA